MLPPAAAVAVTAAAAAAAAAAALDCRRVSEFWGERKGEVLALLMRWAWSWRWAEWARAGLMAPVERWP